MGMPEKWGRGYRPDPKVLELIDKVRHAVERGEARAIAVVLITPQLDVEGDVAGDIDQVRKRLLAAGLTEVSHKLLSKPE